jgi:hypothetical protein
MASASTAKRQLPFHEGNLDDINTIAQFLASPQVPSLLTFPSVDVLVLCGNGIVPIAEAVFDSLEKRPDLTRTLVICGGIGHSTKHLYDAVERSAKYTALANEVRGLPEASVFDLILKRYYPRLADRASQDGLKIIIEDKSTNCGDNAIQSRKVLELHDIREFKSCIIVQDPTMSLRTRAAFEHTYREVQSPPAFLTCPIFVPRTYVNAAGVLKIGAAQAESLIIGSAELWEPQRFVDLVMGEIPRLRDDKNGYGPLGKDFIVHVDIPAEVEQAWKRLESILEFTR